MVKKKLKTKYLIVFSITTIILMIISIFVGQYKTSWINIIKEIIINQNNSTIINIIYNIRIPRTLSAFLIGGSLAVSGTTYQCVFRNNLVSQDILGVSSGACVGAALGIILGFNAFSIQTIAFIVGCVSIIFVFLLSSFIRMNKTVSLILSGILIGGIMSSILGLIKYLAKPETHLQEIVFWTMGNISSISLIQLFYAFVPIGISLIIIYILRWKLNYFTINDSEAVRLGFDIKIHRIIFLITSTIIVASCVSVAGSIGWIGLVIPQLVRILVGSNNNDTIPLSFVIGSSFLLLVDICDRVISTAELPISILSGIIGLPMFIFCLYINYKNNSYSKND